MRVVLLHGFTQAVASWQKVRRAMIAAGADEAEVLAPDLPGHGGAPAVADSMSLQLAASELAEAYGRATYVGYSMGGRVALQLALEHPRVVEGLVLVSTTAGIEDLDARAERRQADEELAERIEAGGDEGLPEFLEEWLAGPLFVGLGEAEADLGARLVNKASGLAGALRALGTGAQLPLWELLPDIAAPTLVVAGDGDEKFSEIAVRLQEAIGENALRVVVPGASHAVPFERPEAFARLVLDFTTGRLAASPDLG